MALALQKATTAALIPARYSNHWDMVVVSCDAKTIYWSDSLYWGPPDGMLLRIMQLMVIVCPQADMRKWRISAGNYFLRELGFAKQEDSFSCGFYALAAASQLAIGRSLIPEANFGARSQRATRLCRIGAAKAHTERVKRGLHKLKQVRESSSFARALRDAKI